MTDFTQYKTYADINSAEAGITFTDANGVQISHGTNSVEYKEYLAWLAAGNTPLPADPVPVV